MHSSGQPLFSYLEPICSLDTTQNSDTPLFLMDVLNHESWLQNCCFLCRFDFHSSRKLYVFYLKRHQETIIDSEVDDDEQKKCIVLFLFRRNVYERNFHDLNQLFNKVLWAFDYNSNTLVSVLNLCESPCRERVMEHSSKCR